jgi:hypothetical protein
LIDDYAPRRGHALVDPDETDENDHREDGTRNEVKGAKGLNAMRNQQVKGDAYGQPGNGNRRGAWGATHYRQHAPDEEEGDPREQGRRSYLNVSQSEVQNYTQDSEREEYVEKRNHSQPCEDFLRVGVDESD